MALDFIDLGLGSRQVDYLRAWDLQREIHEEVAAGSRPDAVLLLEHEAVYTAGRRTEPHELPTDGSRVIDVDRGGKITWHGPGQLVAYPVLSLPDTVRVVDYVRRLEEAMIRTFAEFGLTTGRVDGRSGVWLPADTVAPDGPSTSSGRGETGSGPSTSSEPGETGSGPSTSSEPGETGPGPSTSSGPGETGPGPSTSSGRGTTSSSPSTSWGPERRPERKIAAIGVRVSSGVSMHGLAMNITNPLDVFDPIVPCGIADAGVTNLAAETDQTPTLLEVADLLRRHLDDLLSWHPYEKSPDAGQPVPKTPEVIGSAAVNYPGPGSVSKETAEAVPETTHDPATSPSLTGTGPPGRHR